MNPLDGFQGNSPPGWYRPNALGLYDLVGNVMEWCRDPVDESGRPLESGRVDASQPAFRIFRGGGISLAPQKARITFRSPQFARRQTVAFGVRCVIRFPRRVEP